MISYQEILIFTIKKGIDIIKKIIFFPMILSSVLASYSLHADSFSVTYSNSNQQLGYEKIVGYRAQATFSISISEYFSLNLSAGNEYQRQYGYKEIASDVEGGESSFEYFDTVSKADSVGVDFSLILYAGDVFVPFVFLGGEKKNYELTIVTEEDGVRETSTSTIPVVAPKYGVGLGIAITKNISLKVTYSAQPGVKQNPGDAEPTSVQNTSMNVGLTFKL